MSLNSEEGRQAHSQIGSEGLPTAAASPSHSRDSLARDACDLRGPYPVVGDCRATAGQPFPIGVAPGVPLRRALRRIEPVQLRLLTRDHHAGAAVAAPVDCFDLLRERIRADDRRRARLRLFTTVLPVSAALWAAIIFAAQMLRGAF